MERNSIESQVRNAEFYDHGDTEESADNVWKILQDRGLNDSRLAGDTPQTLMVR